MPLVIRCWFALVLVGAIASVASAGDDPAKSLARSYAINELGSDGYYMAFGMQTPDALVARVSRALATIKANGTYDALKKKWL